MLCYSTLLMVWKDYGYFGFHQCFYSMYYVTWVVVAYCKANSPPFLV